ncbi:hypothetical protein GOBAR_DD03337 [Gossypium barbadense]|nr:hypothetical protein GOBAR_DD03337 [Gossypium barbadense]
MNHVLRFCATARDVWLMMGYPLHVVSAQMNLLSGFQVRWFRPPAGVVKINVDAGFRLNQKTAATGVVIRDENGEILGLVAKSLTLFFQSLQQKQSGNKTTYAMAQEGLNQGEDGYWVEDAPTLVEAVAAEDCRLHEPL